MSTLAPRPVALELLRLLRPYQWSKNVLVCTALASSHRLADRAAWPVLLQLFLAFCALASAIYVLNDWLDREHDRRHPDKCSRAFAAGTLGPRAALLLIPLLLGLAVALAWRLELPARLALLAYGALSLAYCLLLKRLLWLDVVALAALYALRVIAGAFAIQVEPSAWLIGFTLFLFLSLATLKRYAELVRAHTADMPGRAYRNADLPIVLAVGIGTGLLATLVLALYVNSPQVMLLYARPNWIWLACPLLLYWLVRLWTFAARGQLPSDPLLFALRDPASHAVALLGALLLWLAT